MRSFAILALVLLLPLAGCDDSPTELETPEVSDVSGSWSGTTEGITVDLTLAQPTDSDVSGNGSITGSTQSLTLTVEDGTFVHPHLSLTLGIDGFADVNLSGKMQGESVIHGTLNGSGFNRTHVTLTRQ